jgi:RNA-directed DNA polymerase
MLKAGYLEDWNFNKTYSGTPQGGVISPILANVYLHELDVFMADLYQRTQKGERRKVTSEYRRIDNEKGRLRKLMDRMKDENLEVVPEVNRGNPLKYAGNTRSDLSKKLEELTNEQLKTRYHDPQDPDYRRLQYTRYADDFLLGFIGSKAEAQAIMEEVKGFLQTALRLECSEEKTKIVHHSKGVIFLGYHVATHALKANADRARSQIQDGRKIMRRRWNGSGINLLVPESKVRDFVKRKRYGNLNNGRNWEALHRAELTRNSDYEILAQYNAEVRGFAEYYKLAGNYYKRLGHLHYIAQTSLLKTLANKRKTSVAKIYQRYTDGDDKRITVVDGKYRKEWFKLKDINRKAKTRGVDEVYNHMHHSRRSEITERLNAEECEYCGKTGGYFEVHHVRKMADIKEGKELWQKVMIARNRKKLVICVECHDLLHAGKLHDFRHKAKSA